MKIGSLYRLNSEYGLSNKIFIYDDYPPSVIDPERDTWHTANGILKLTDDHVFMLLEDRATIDRINSGLSTKMYKILLTTGVVGWYHGMDDWFVEVKETI
jgi:hypothetical protein